ncbi:MAG: hypothetical protein QGI02_11825 [Vicinamibacterales bacterium]|nr:hypothetical protein [Vicinamibacterales bacterium]
MLAAVAAVGLIGVSAKQPSATPKRINKALELLAQGQPIYYTQVNRGGYDEGLALARTFAGYITYNLEHSAFDIASLEGFMRGLVEGVTLEIAALGARRPGHQFGQATKPIGAIEEGQPWANMRKARVVRQGPFKLIQIPHLDREELFHLAFDPDEQNNLLRRPSARAREIADELRSAQVARSERRAELQGRGHRGRHPLCSRVSRSPSSSAGYSSVSHG